MSNEKTILSDANTRMQKSVQVFKNDLKTIRTSRASPDLVENLTADYYGVPTPLNQMASITVPDARLLMIQPWDRQTLRNIERGILQSDLGLVPNNDGTVIRINIPILTEERRKELVKLVGRRLEDSRLAIRNIRREGVDQIKKLEYSKALSSDDSRVSQQDVQKLTDSHIQQLETVAKDKEREVMEV